MNDFSTLRPETQEAVKQFLKRQEESQSRVVQEGSKSVFINKDGARHEMTLQERVFYRAGLLKIQGLERLYNRQDQQGT